MNQWGTRQPRKPMPRTGWRNPKKESEKKAEERFQYQVIELARHLGWFPVHILNMGGTAAGVPDLFLFRERLVWIELKAYSDLTGKAGRLSPEQIRFFEVLKDAGQEAYVVWDDDDGWAELKRILARPGVPQ
jgi:hypothetical protein